jgi:hypothetical protein
VGLIDPHIAFALLRICCGYCSGVYYMRSCGSHPCFRVLDDATVSSFDSFAAPVTPDTLQQICLPIRHGGFGLRPTEPFAAIAFCAAWHASLRAQHHLTTLPDTVEDELAVATMLDPIFESFPATRDSVMTYLGETGRPGDHAQKTEGIPRVHSHVLSGKLM